MDNVQRKSERSNKGVPPTRFGFEHYCGPEGAFGGINLNPDRAMQNQPNNGARGSIASIEKTMVRAENASNGIQNFAKSVASGRPNTKASRRSSIREVTHLKQTLEHETEIYEIEMQKLEKKKEFLLRTQRLEQELKEKQDALSNESNDEEKSEINDEQHNRDVHEWVNNVPSYKPLEQAERINRNRQPPFESTHLNSGAEYNSQTQNDLLIAAFKALQAKEAKDLPVFNGESVFEWPNFISEFRRSTKEFKITPNKNLRRLDKALKGEARTSVQTLLTSPDNIELIISHLANSFGRREWILEHLVLDLKDMPAMKNENIGQFKVFHSKLFGTVTTIKNMNALNYLDTPELLLNLEEKLPPTTKNYWIHFKADLLRRREKVNIEALGDWFKFELDAQFAGLSAKDVIKVSKSEDDQDDYIPETNEFP